MPIVVAINKMDVPGANPDRVKKDLADHELLPEEWGGDTIMVPVSAQDQGWASTCCWRTSRSRPRCSS